MLTFLGVASLVTGLVSGGVKIASGIANRNAQEAEKKLQLERQQEQLKTAQSNLKESYDLSIRQSEAQTKEANAMLDLQAGQTEAARDMNLKTAGRSTELQDRVAASQIAGLQVEASQKEGQAVQSAAVSGFRNAGSVLNNIRGTSESNQRAVKQAMLQRELARYSDYSSARASFLNAENQLTLYREQIKNNESELARYKEKAEVTYRQQKEELDRESKSLQEDEDFMNSSTYKWARGLGYASDIFGGISSGVSMASNVYSMGTGFGWK